MKVYDNVINFCFEKWGRITISEWDNMRVDYSCPVITIFYIIATSQQEMDDGRWKMDDVIYRQAHQAFYTYGLIFSPTLHNLRKYYRIVYRPNNYSYGVGLSNIDFRGLLLEQ